MKKFIGLFIVLCVLFSFVPVYAGETITLPNGSTLNIKNLTNDEIKKAIEIARKSAGNSEPNNVSTIGQFVSGINPEALDNWRKLITGTIKDICNDLSISVNEFVKTPVGFGVALGIAYQVMGGKEIIDDLMDYIIMIPLWFILTGVILFLGWYCYSGKTYYNSISYNEKGRKIKEGLVRKTRFPWAERQGKEMTNKEIFAWFLIIAELLGTCLTLLIVLI